MVPNGGIMQSEQTGHLELPTFSPEACEAHVFSSLASGSLLSIGKLCDDGCTATFDATKVLVKRNGHTVLTGHRSSDTRLWYIDVSSHNASPPATSPVAPPSYSANSVLPTNTVADRVAWIHATMCSPTLSTLCAAIDAGRLTTFPSVTSAQVRQYPPPSSAMIKGHLDQQRANLRSTQPKSTLKSTKLPVSVLTISEAESDLSPPPTEPPALRSHHLYVDCQPVGGKIFTDQTGRFLAPSSSGNTDMLVLYDFDSNAILVEPMKGRSGPQILAAYKRAIDLLTRRGLKPQLQRLDNEASTALQQFMTSVDVDYQLAPPHVHRRNAAERAIRTFKNHFIACLCGTDKDFPLHLWDRLLPQALLTLNLLRGSRINPRLSAHAQLHGAFDYNRTPLAPPGTKVLVHEKPSTRGTWAPHAVPGFYLCPAWNHYRCYRIWMTETSRERIADTLVWQPTQVVMPTASTAELAIAACTDLTNALLHPSPASPLSPLSDSQVAEITRLATIFSTITNAQPASAQQSPVPPGFAPLPSEPAPVPSPTIAAPVPRVHFAPLPRVSSATRHPVPLPDPVPVPAPVLVPVPVPVHASVAAVPVPALTYQHRTQDARNRSRRTKTAEKKATAATRAAATKAASQLTTKATAKRAAAAAKLAAAKANRAHRLTADANRAAATNAAATTAPAALQPQPQHQHQHNTRRRPRRPTPGGVTATLNSANLATQLAPFPLCANAVIDPITGASLEYEQLRSGPDSAAWIQACANEIGRLAQGNFPLTKSGTDTMFFISHKDLPSHKKATYLRIVAKIRAEKKETHRVRFTVGGNLIQYDGNVSTPTADLTTAKLLFNSVLSTPNAKFMTIDIKDFYLNTPMDEYEYMRIPVKVIPDCIMEQYKLAPLVHNGFVLVEIRKGMYGLPQAGKLANDRLVEHLARSGYVQAKRTPGLFTHVHRPIIFSLVVDDFGVQYTGQEHAQHLADTLENLYTITTEWPGTRYLGLTLDWDYAARTVDMSMPGYIANALTKFQHESPQRPQHSPHAWTAPAYGASTQLTPPEDVSAPLSPARLTRMQEIIGTLLYYARAIDSTLLVALGTLASAQSKGTEATAQALTQLLNYCATHPDAVIRYHASDMCLLIHSDASYLSERHAKSRSSGYYFLSDLPTDPTATPDPNGTPPPDNGAIHVHSAIMKPVLSSATEAEAGSLFFNCKEGTTFRTTLSDMGWPQPPTPIQTDNSCAAGIANNTIKQRRSKAIDMRFYWVQDRVAQGQFLVHWRRGKDNLADYFSKHHSPAHHRLMRPQYLHTKAKAT